MQMSKKNEYNYYVEREHANAAQVNKRLANRAKEIEKILNEEKQVILARIDKFYKDFADTYGMSEEQAKKLVSQFDVDSFKQRAKEYVNNKDTSYDANYDMRLYDTKQRISRLQLLLNEINLDIAEGYQKSIVVMNDILATNQIKELERQANLFKLPKNQVRLAMEALLRETYTGAAFSSYWGKDLTNLYDVLDVAIKGAILNGQHPYQLKNQINKEFGVKDNWSKRLLITETTRMQSMVQIAAMKEAGYEYFRFIAESKACDECSQYRSKVFRLKDWEKLAVIPPLHPHCRCSLVPAMEEDYLEDMNWQDELGISTEANELLNELQRRSFNTGRLEGKELLSLIDLNNDKLVYELKGNENSVGFSKELINLLKKAPKGSFILNHNHPSDYNSSFSKADIFQLYNYNSIKAMTLVTDDKTSYYLDRNNKYFNFLNKMGYEVMYDSIRNEVLNQYSDNERKKYWKELTDKINKKVSEKIGIKYRRL